MLWRRLVDVVVVLLLDVGLAEAAEKPCVTDSDASRCVAAVHRAPVTVRVR
jgi:hypothetical protein